MKKDFLRPCPVCGNHQGDILHHQRFAVPDRFPLAREYDVVACDQCGFAYADIPSQQVDDDRYYREFSKYEDALLSTGGAANVWDANRIDRTAEDIARTAGDGNASIIDVGCANGGLLAALRKRGFDRLIGVDPAPACVAHVASRGFRAFEGDVFFHDANNSLPPDETFDCLILCHVLIAFVDRDRKKQGTLLGAILVCPPGFLSGFTGKINVCSAINGSEILSYIRQMGLPNEVIVL